MPGEARGKDRGVDCQYYLFRFFHNLERLGRGGSVWCVFFLWQLLSLIFSATSQHRILPGANKRGASMLEVLKKCKHLLALSSWRELGVHMDEADSIDSVVERVSWSFRCLAFFVEFI